MASTTGAAMKLSLHEVLENGTEVRVGNQFGKVISHKVVNAVPCGTIVVHTIEFHSKRVRSFGRNYKVIPTFGKSQVNYSFIITQ
jgi:hypothetical protein